MNQVRWTQRALWDLVEIGDFIAQDKPDAARAWVERLRERALVAAQAPLAGRMVPEVNREDIREAFLRSYRILYRVVPDAIVVLTVVEGHRRLPAVDANVELSTVPKLKPENAAAKLNTTSSEFKTGKTKRAGTRPGTKKPRVDR